MSSSFKYLFAGIIGLVGGSFSCTAAPLLSFGGKVPLVVTADVGVRYQDNVYLRRDKEGDVLASVTPGLSFSTVGGEASVRVSLAEQFVAYLDHSELNRALPNLSGSVSYDTARTQLAFETSYVEQDQTNLTIRNFDESLRQTATAMNLDGTWSASAKTKVHSGAKYNKTNYRGNDAIDNDSWMVPLDLYYAITPKVDASVGYQFRRSREPTGNFDSKDHFLNVGLRGEFTSKLNGNVRVGLNRRRLDFGTTDNTLGLGTSLTYAYSPVTAFNLDISRDFRTSFSGESQRVLSVRLDGTLDFNEVWGANAGISWEDSRYLRLGSRRDRFLAFEARVTYVLTRQASMALAYYLRESASSVDFFDFSSNVISLNASFRF